MRDRAHARGDEAGQERLQGIAEDGGQGRGHDTDPGHEPQIQGNRGGGRRQRDEGEKRQLLDGHHGVDADQVGGGQHEAEGGDGRNRLRSGIVGGQGHAYDEGQEQGASQTDESGDTDELSGYG